MPDPLKADQPDGGDTHVDKPLGKKRSPGMIFLAKLRELLKGSVSAEEFSLAVKSARGHAGGMGKAAAKKQSQAQAAAEPAADDDMPPTSLMVGFWLPLDYANILALPGGETPDELHLTLAYFGHMDELGEMAEAHLQVAVEAIARDTAPLAGRISGYGRFSNPDGDVFYASVDMPGLAELRTRICERCCWDGLEAASNHGFTPHITLAYLAKDDPSPVPVDAEIRFRIDTLVVAAAGEHTEFALSGIPGSAGARTSPYAESNVAQLCAKGSATRLFNELEAFLEPPEWIPYLPIPGSYTHPSYGQVAITVERNAEFVEHFSNGVYQSELPVDGEHDFKNTGAFAWIKEMRQNDDGSVDARVEYTDRGRKMLEEDRYKYFSPEYYPTWSDPLTDEVFSNVAVGGAFTTRPFFKEGALRSLVASERGLEVHANLTDPDPSPVAFTHIAPAGAPTQAALAARKEPEMAIPNPQADPQAASDPNVTPAAVTLPAPVVTPPAQVTPPVVASEPPAGTMTMAELQTRLAASEQRAATLQATTEQQATVIQQAAERVGALESNVRRQRYGELVAGRGGPTDGAAWFGEGAKHVGFLEDIATKFGEDSEQFKFYVQQQDALAAQIATSKLFGEVGSGLSGGPSADSADGRIEALVLAHMAEHKVGRPEATDAVLTANPQLYTEHRAEHSRRMKG